MNTRVLEYIIAIAEEQSVSRAAERFYLSHAALSTHLKKLERELGTPLFRRTPAGMEPTPAGLIFLADARAILHQEQTLERALADMRQQKRQTIRVMVDMPFYNRFVQQVLPRFAQLRPDYTVDIVKCNAQEVRTALLQGRALLGVAISASAAAADLVYLPFYSSSLHLVFPGGYSGRTDPEGLREALDAGLLLSLYPSGSTMNLLVRQRLAAAGIQPDRVMEGETRTIIEHVKSGTACCALPAFFCTSARQDGLTVGDGFAAFHHVIAYPPHTALPPAAQELMKLIIGTFSF